MDSPFRDTNYRHWRGSKKEFLRLSEKLNFFRKKKSTKWFLEIFYFCNRKLIKNKLTGVTSGSLFSWSHDLIINDQFRWGTKVYVRLSPTAIASVTIWPGVPSKYLPQVQWFMYQNWSEPSSGILHQMKRNRLLWLRLISDWSVENVVSVQWQHWQQLLPRLPNLLTTNFFTVFCPHVSVSSVFVIQLLSE